MIRPGSHPYPVVLILTSLVPCTGNQLPDHVRQRQRPVRDHLGRCILNSQRGGEERAGVGDVATLGDVHVDDLAVFVDCSVDVGPGTAAITAGVVAGVVALKRGPPH